MNNVYDTTTLILVIVAIILVVVLFFCIRHAFALRRFGFFLKTPEALRHNIPENVYLGYSKGKKEFINKSRGFVFGERKIQSDSDMSIAQTYFLKTNKFNKEIGVEYWKEGIFSVDKEKRLYFFSPNKRYNVLDLYKIDDIIEIALVINNSQIIESTSGFGGALAGGVLFGTTGAIVGSTMGGTSSHTDCKSMQIDIITKNVNNAYLAIDLLPFPINIDAEIYKDLELAAKKIFATLKSFLAENKE